MNEQVTPIITGPRNGEQASVAGWQERQLPDAHLHDGFGDGFLDLAFELFDGLGVQARHQSDFFVLSVFN